MPVSGRKFVIIGGAGLIGSALTWVLGQQAEVIVCDSIGPVQTGKWQNLFSSMADLWTPESLATNLEKSWREVAGIVLCADAGQETQDGDALFAASYHLPRQVWDFACAKQKPIAWASSLQVYGNGPSNLSMDPAHVASLQPTSAFGRAKKAFDVFAAANANGPDKPPVVTGFRVASAYGSGEAHKGGDASLPMRALNAARAGKPIALWASQNPAMTDGGHERDWVHAHDAAAAMAHLITKEASGFFDIGTGETTSALGVARIAGRVTKAQASVGFVTPPPGAQIENTPPADLAPLRAAGFEGTFRSLEDGLSSL